MRINRLSKRAARALHKEKQEAGPKKSNNERTQALLSYAPSPLFKKYDSC